MFQVLLLKQENNKSQYGGNKNWKYGQENMCTDLDGHAHPPDLVRMADCDIFERLLLSFFRYHSLALRLLPLCLSVSSVNCYPCSSVIYTVILLQEKMSTGVRIILYDFSKLQHLIL